MKFLETIKSEISKYNLFIYIFLIWNAFKLFFINSDPIIQVLNLLLSIGIYFCIEDKKLKINNRRRLDFFIGIIGITFTLIRSFFLNNVDDKYYYFNLPIGIFFLIIILNPFKEFAYLKNIFLISLLLPFRRLFFELANFLLGSLIPSLTWFVLFSLGQNPILDGQNITIKDHQFTLSKGCWGADNLYFVLATLIIYSCIFRLRKIKNISILIMFSTLISIVINVIRNNLLVFIISSNISNREDIFVFLHDSYGSLIFSFFSILIISFLYFNFLNKELNS
jgi:exosortase/archaeosortase family protein